MIILILLLEELEKALATSLTDQRTEEQGLGLVWRSLAQLFLLGWAHNPGSLTRSYCHLLPPPPEEQQRTYMILPLQPVTVNLCSLISNAYSRF